MKSPDRTTISRRGLVLGAAATAALARLSRAAQAQHAMQKVAPLPFRISLAQWSLHRTIRSGALDPLDFARYARERFGIEGAEYVSTFYEGHETDFAYLADMKQRADDAGTRSLLIMVDGEGALGDADPAARRLAIENHFPWIAAAAYLGCHAIRVNAHGSGSDEEQARQAAESLHRLAEISDPYGIDVIVENHGGLSSNGRWLAGVMQAADHPRVGTLPDFGNFRLQDDEQYDRYRGVEELMPFARAVSAKSYAFDEAGDETTIDFARMLGIVTGAGYHGWIGVEYEGDRLSEDEGIRKTKALLERLRDELASR